MEGLTPELRIRLLYAKAHELTFMVQNAPDGHLRPIDEVRADIALVAELLADYMKEHP